jgi:hypothetical protein
VRLRIPLILTLLLAGVALGFAKIVAAKTAGDRCANTAPPEAVQPEGFDLSILPWKWTCVYLDKDGHEIRQGRTVWGPTVRE